MDLQSIKELIALVDQSEISELKLEQEGFKLVLRKQVPQAPQLVQAPPLVHGPVMTPYPHPPAPVHPLPEAPVKEAAREEDNPNLVTIPAPMVGNFYCAPSPDAPPYVEVGSLVEPETVVCIIEAMKLMNEIEADVRGRVVAVLVENGQAVEYGQPLFKIEKV